MLEKLPPFTNTQILIEAKQEVPDIMREVLQAHQYFASDYDRIAAFFDTGSLLDFCKNLFQFCKLNIAYKIEKDSNQTTKSPAAILTTGEGDCKHYASFIAGNLQALERLTGEKINWCYRFASYSIWDNTPAHVFVVVKIDGKEYWIDPVLSSFNSRAVIPVSYIDQKVKNKKMSLSRISGLGFLQIEDSPLLSGQIQQMPVAYADDYLQTNAATQIVNLPEASISDPGADDIPPEIENMIQMLLYYGIIDSNMTIHNDIFISKMEQLEPEDAAELADAYGQFIEKSQTVGNIFKDIWNFTKQVVGAPARGAYLSLVSLNVFGFATKLNKCITLADGSKDQAGIDKLQDVWHDKLRGDTNILLRAIKNGAPKKQILGIGVVAAAAPAWVAAATAIIAALAPVITGILKSKQDAGYSNISAADFAYMNGSSSSSLTDQLKKYAPIILIGGVALYLYLDKKKK